MKFNLPVTVLFAIVMAVDAVSAYPIGEDAVSILNRTDEAMRKLGSISGGFRQEVELTLMGETRSFGGRVYYRHPDLLRLEYDEPPGQLLICDGESFWMVMTDQDRPQVFRTPFTGEISGFLSHSMLRFLIENYDARVVEEADIEGTPCYKISFSPAAKDPAVPVHDLLLWVGMGDALSRKLSYEDLAGNRIVYYFYGWRRVETHPDDLFSYTPSPHADLFENVFSP